LAFASKCSPNEQSWSRISCYGKYRGVSSPTGGI
jgi:hypothetical protein